MRKTSNQRANYSQTRRSLAPDLNFVVGLASLLAGAQASITKHPKPCYRWEHVWETLLLCTYNSAVVIASLFTVLAANLNDTQRCRSPFLPLFIFVFFSPLWNIFAYDANWKSSKLECTPSLRRCKGDRLLLETFLPFLFHFCCSHAAVGSFRSVSEGKHVKCMQSGSGPVRHFTRPNICSCALLLICRRRHMGTEIRTHQIPVIKRMCL